MGYLHIENTYKQSEIFELFRECYALEKIHGTSAHVGYKTGEPLRLFAGGGKHETFVALFDVPALTAACVAQGLDSFTVFGESYGGSMQGMKATYGDKLRFVAFDVQVGDVWLAVPQAEDLVKTLGLEFVHYARIQATVEAADAERDSPSTQAKRNGVVEDKHSEGVILRPLVELRKNNGSRLIAKHKRAEFGETKTPRSLNQEDIKVLSDAKAIAEEWVVPMRLEHVLQKLPEATGMEHTSLVVKAMLEDVRREGAGEIVWTKEAEKEVGRAAAQAYKKRVQAVRVAP